MNNEIRTLYLEKEDAAHKAFHHENTADLAKMLLEKGEDAAKMYELEHTDEWDLRTYGSYNAAGGAYEELGEKENASKCYKIALASCGRLADHRGYEMSKNIEFLKGKLDPIT